MLTDELIQQVFFYCENDSPDGCFADTVDIFEFARKIEAVVIAEARKEEHIRCVGIVNNLNREVAAVLASKVP